MASSTLPLASRKSIVASSTLSLASRKSFVASSTLPLANKKSFVANKNFTLADKNWSEASSPSLFSERTFAFVNLHESKNDEGTNQKCGENKL